MTNLELTLEPVPDSVPRARQTLDRLADAVEEPLLENLRLLVSEVVTNSIRHGEGFDPIELRVLVRPLVVRVEVEDRGPGFEPRLADEDGEREVVHELEDIEVQRFHPCIIRGRGPCQRAKRAWKEFPTARVGLDS